ncbi:hypothetical protein Tco_0774037 [Tanacetum coccineum]|uniref:Uncharacterized protein n=1 Tax=Tanacetum coccineum TaxID=301880 RepID=A0ABQ4ZPG0_9ASTR
MSHSYVSAADGMRQIGNQSQAVLHDALRALVDMLLVAMLIEDVPLVVMLPRVGSSEAEKQQPLGSRVPLMSEEFEASELSGDELREEDTEKDEEDESLNANDERERVVPVVDIAVSKPLGLGYGEARRHPLESTEEIAPSTYEVGQSSRSMPEQEGAERVYAFRQPTLVTWVDPEDGRVYTDIPTYVPLAAPIQTPPYLEWSVGSLLVSPSSPIVPSPIASLVATPATTISRLYALPPTLFEGYDRDLKELYTRSGVVRDEIFSQRYRFRSLEQEQERATVTFNAIWRPILALEAWAGQTDAYRAVL